MESLNKRTNAFLSSLCTVEPSAFAPLLAVWISFEYLFERTTHLVWLIDAACRVLSGCMYIPWASPMHVCNSQGSIGCSSTRSPTGRTAGSTAGNSRSSVARWGAWSSRRAKISDTWRRCVRPVRGQFALARLALSLSLKKVVHLASCLMVLTAALESKFQMTHDWQEAQSLFRQALSAASLHTHESQSTLDQWIGAALPGRPVLWYIYIVCIHFNKNKTYCNHIFIYMWFEELIINNDKLSMYSLLLCNS